MPYKDYEQKAVEYAEKYGIVEWDCHENEMTYDEHFLLEGKSYKVTVNLDTMKESRKEM